MIGFTISTLIGAGIVESLSGVSVSVTSPNLLNIFSLSSIQTQVNSITAITFRISCENPIGPNSIVVLSLPNDISLTDTSTVSGIFNIAYSLNYLVIGNEITISNGLTTYLSAKSIIEFEVANVQYPSSTKPTGDIKIQIKTSLGGLICENNDGFNTQATSGNFKSINITPSVKTINANATFQFDFELGNGISSLAVVRITAPPQIKIDDRVKDSCFKIISGFSTSALCEVKESMYVYIYEAFGSDYLPGLLSIQIDRVYNP